jgi:hypothetical protein
LRSFVDRLIAQDARYDWRGAIAFQKRRSVYIDELLNNLEKNYGRIATKNEFAKKSYFCSALVVACYTLSGIIGDNAQIVYRPDVFSPGDLHADPTFGWFLGYITQKGPNIPLSDPLLTLTLWKDNEEMRCW